MTRSAAVTTVEHTLHATLELSKNSWLLAIQFPDRDSPSLYPIRGGNAEGLMAKLDAARDRLAKVCLANSYYVFKSPLFHRLVNSGGNGTIWVHA